MPANRTLLIAIFMMFIGGGYITASAQSAITFEERTLTHDGRERFYLLYVPPQYDSTTPMPLMFVFHGGGGNPYMYEEMTRFGEKARDEGFILVYPAGSGRFRNQLLTWNAVHCCAYALEQGVDDVGFVRAMVQTLQDEFAIDPARIYATGHSNGAILSYLLVAEMSDIFAAVGIMAGTIGGYPSPDSTTLHIISQPEHPVSIIHIHGVLDDSLRYHGGITVDSTGSQRNDLSVAESIAFWVEANQCNTPPQTETHDNGFIIIDTYACDVTQTAVKLITIVDSGHSWAGGVAPRRTSDTPSQRVSATDEIWAFFASHPKP